MPKKDSGVTKEKHQKSLKRFPSLSAVPVCCVQRGRASSTRSAKIQKRRSIRYGVLWMADMRKLRLGIRPMIYTL